MNERILITFWSSIEISTFMKILKYSRKKLFEKNPYSKIFKERHLLS
jgi:hypothetical protein